MWNDLPYNVCDTGTLDGFIGAVERWLLPLLVFSSVFRGVGTCGVAKAICKNFVFPTWAYVLVFIIIIIDRLARLRWN